MHAPPERSVRAPSAAPPTRPAPSPRAQDNVAGWILEIDRGALLPHHGNYTAWLGAKAARLDREEAQQLAQVCVYEHVVPRRDAAADPMRPPNAPRSHPCVSLALARRAV